MTFIIMLNSMTLELPRVITVVCHDAGGANQILALLATLAQKKHEIRAVMKGPAADFWQRRFPDQMLYSDPHTALETADMLLSGTGWASDLEHDARRLAAEKKIYSVTMLDHWVNYETRFVRDGLRVYPDEIWVADDDAKKLARITFPSIKIVQVSNFYLREQVAALPSPSMVSPEFLYVLEPARNDWGRGVPGEFQALDYFASNLKKLNLPAATTIRIRPHPSDPIGKYDTWIATNSSLSVVLDESPDMSVALARARWIAGCETYALVLALASGRHAYCSLPPWAPSCRLPQQGLIHLKDLR